MNISRTIGKLFGWSIVANILSFAGLAIFAQQLGAASIGSFFLFQSIVEISALAGDFGVSTSVEKHISAGRDPSRTFCAGAVLKAFPVLTMVGGLLVFQNYIDEYLGIGVVGALAVALIVRHLERVLSSSLRGAQLVEETAVFRGFSQIIWISGGLILIAAGFGVLALVYSYVAGKVSVAALAIYRLHPELVRPGKNDFLEIIDVAKWSYVSGLGGATYNWMDVVLIGVFLGQEAVGIYEVAWRLATTTLIFSQAVRRVAFPKINAEGSRSNPERISELMTRFFTPSLFFVIPSFIGLSLIGEDVLSIVFGTEFGAAGLVLGILMIEKVQRAFSYVLIAPAYAIDRADIGAKSTAAAVASNIGLNILLIPMFGIVGAAIATTISETINFGIHGAMLIKYVRIELPWREFSGIGISVLIMAGALHAYAQMVIIDGWVELISAILLSVTTFLGIAYLDPVLKQRIKTSLSELAP